MIRSPLPHSHSVVLDGNWSVRAQEKSGLYPCPNSRLRESVSSVENQTSRFAANRDGCPGKCHGARHIAIARGASNLIRSRSPGGRNRSRQQIQKHGFFRVSRHETAVGTINSGPRIQGSGAAIPRRAEVECDRSRPWKTS
jgi:hypothetical protein